MHHLIVSRVGSEHLGFGVVLEQGGGLEGGKRLVAASGVPDDVFTDHGAWAVGRQSVSDL